MRDETFFKKAVVAGLAVASVACVVVANVAFAGPSAETFATANDALRAAETKLADAEALSSASVTAAQDMDAALGDASEAAASACEAQNTYLRVAVASPEHDVAFDSMTDLFPIAQNPSFGRARWLYVEDGTEAVWSVAGVVPLTTDSVGVTWRCADATGALLACCVSEWSAVNECFHDTVVRATPAGRGAVDAEGGSSSSAPSAAEELVGRIGELASEYGDGEVDAEALANNRVNMWGLKEQMTGGAQ